MTVDPNLFWTGLSFLLLVIFFLGLFAMPEGWGNDGHPGAVVFVVCLLGTFVSSVAFVIAFIWTFLYGAGVTPTGPFA